MPFLRNFHTSLKYLLSLFFLKVLIFFFLLIRCVEALGEMEENLTAKFNSGVFFFLDLDLDLFES